tara:strand:+ start:1527 stop:2765 length:1239 start_codon:yes stop_codon:yes gene_type:complete
MLFIENNYNNKEILITMELYRGIEYCKLHDNFFKSCLMHLSSSVFNIKKKHSRTISNLLSSWMFTLYSNYDFNDDPFFPTEFMYFDNLKNTLLDYTSIHNIKDECVKINNIINELSHNYKKILLNLKQYNDVNDNHIVINKIQKFEKRGDKLIEFIKFDINHNVNISNIKLKSILENILIPKNIYLKMIKKCKNKLINKDKLIWIILFRYQLLSSNNNQLAVLPNILDKMEKDFNLKFETFGSAINTNTKNFCSLYYDVEKYFGSVGSFFNTKFLEGCYSFNPPYQEDIIDNGIKKILNYLYNSKVLEMKLTFLITIPIWDIDGKNKMKELNSENNNDKINYNDMKIIKTMKKSKYFQGLRMVSKNDFTYIDYNFHLFKNTTIQNTYLFVLSNFKNDYINKINNYDFFNYNI